MAKEKYEKGDVIYTIPCGLCLVKSRKKDDKGLFYTVRTKSNSKFFIPERLVVRKATNNEQKQFKINKPTT